MPIDALKLARRLVDAGMEPRVAFALSEEITEIYGPRSAPEANGAEPLRARDIKAELRAFSAEMKFALAVQTVAIALAVLILLRLLP